MTFLNPQATTTHQLWFAAPHEVEIRQVVLDAPVADQILVKTLYSAVSAGTEMLVYRGQIPEQMALDASLDTLQSQACYPLQYGYACVGEVIARGPDVDAQWINKRVFSFQPHASHFLTKPDQLIVIPDDIAADAAVFLANMETAVSLVQDGAPILGEQVVVLGQGIVGLLLSGILAQYPLTSLVTLDSYERRRAMSLTLGATASFDPRAGMGDLRRTLSWPKGADLIYEVSGVPEALNGAISLSGFDSRVVIGSWYGNKAAVIALGGDAHRNRLKISTSQVSSLASNLSARWDKTRRFGVAWQMIRQLCPRQLITHRYPLNDARLLYQGLDKNPDQVLQAVFEY
ncbi:MAG: zinc-binding alcohol dehydrogenase [Pseudohongiella sp.]|nr:zinc-binding alcohol dehydrogenase [Pseudohongiella sp.]